MAEKAGEGCKGAQFKKVPPINLAAIGCGAFCLAPLADAAFAPSPIPNHNVSPLGINK
jgi:hypothetical protein